MGLGRWAADELLSDPTGALTVRASKFLIWFATAALAGVGVFALLVWQAVEVTDVAMADAARQFDTARSGAGGGPPLVTRQPDGRFARRESRLPDTGAPIGHIHILAYHAASGRLSRTEVPFWFYKVKAPAAAFLVGDTGLDLSDLGLTAADLEREGPGLVFDDADEAGNRWLVWTGG